MCKVIFVSVCKLRKARRDEKEMMKCIFSTKYLLTMFFPTRGSLGHQDHQGHKVSRVSVETPEFLDHREREVPQGYLEVQGKR